jgi:helicase
VAEVEEAPRYLHWLASQGLFGTIHPCWAIVAADLELRVAWRMLQPIRGAGRLLWACEQMATPADAAQVVPQLWRAARARGHASPDWPGTARPTGCRLDAAGYCGQVVHGVPHRLPQQRRVFSEGGPGALPGRG